MATTRRPAFGIRNRAKSYVVGLTLGLSLILLQPLQASAEISYPAEYRASESIGKTDGVTQYALAMQMRAPGILQAHHAEIAFGAISSTRKDRAFVSVGAVWRLPQEWLRVFGERTFVDLGFSPTWIAGSQVNGRDLGGNFHFTSSVSIGTYLNRTHSLGLSLRVQHTSNGGLDSANPGLDMAGLSIQYQPR